MNNLGHQNYKNEHTERKYLNNTQKKQSFKGKEHPLRIRKRFSKITR